jgi:hypothetical protein
MAAAAASLKPPNDGRFTPIRLRSFASRESVAIASRKTSESGKLCLDQLLATNFWPPTLGFQPVGGRIAFPTGDCEWETVTMTRFVPVTAFLLLLRLCQAAQPFSFATRTDLATTSGVAVASADFNGDGIADLAVLNSLTIEIFLGKGDRRFAPPITIQLNAQPNTFGTLLAADIKGDGQPDLIASGSKTFIFFGNGDGTFTPGPRLGIGGNQVATADFNLDGNLDLAINTGSAIDVLLGDGHDGFSNPVVLSGAPGCLAVGDFNGDGKADVVGCGSNPSDYPAVAVFLGNGNGTFQSPIWSPIPSQASFAAVGDLNADGKPDVAAVAVHENGSNPNVGPIFILYGNGEGTFQAAPQPCTFGAAGRGNHAPSDRCAKYCASRSSA